MGALKLPFILATCAVFCVGGFGCLTFLHSIEKDEAEIVRPGSDPASVLARIKAFSKMKSFVRSKLIAPSTAEFPSWVGDPPNIVQHEGGRTYVVMGYVDSQNVFGAMLRQNYIGRLRHEQDDNWTLLDLRFEDP